MCTHNSFLFFFNNKKNNIFASGVNRISFLFCMHISVQIQCTYFRFLFRLRGYEWSEKKNNRLYQNRRFNYEAKDMRCYNAPLKFHTELQHNSKITFILHSFLYGRVQLCGYFAFTAFLIDLYVTRHHFIHGYRTVETMLLCKTIESAFFFFLLFHFVIRYEIEPNNYFIRFKLPNCLCVSINWVQLVCAYYTNWSVYWKYFFSFDRDDGWQKVPFFELKDAKFHSIIKHNDSCLMLLWRRLFCLSAHFA